MNDNLYLTRKNQFAQYLTQDQTACLKLALQTRKFGCCLQIGGGKTFTALNWANELLLTQKVTKILVLVPASKKSDWVHDASGQLGNIKDAFTAFNVTTIKNSADFGKLLTDDTHDLFICSINLLTQSSVLEFLMLHSTELRPVLGYIFDESSKLKNNQSAISLGMLMLNYICGYGLLLTGSLMSNSYKDLQMQLFLLNESVNDQPLTYKTWAEYYKCFKEQSYLFNTLFLEYADQKIWHKDPRTMEPVELTIHKVVGYKNIDLLLNKLHKKIYVQDAVDKQFTVTETVEYIPYQSGLHYSNDPTNDVKKFLMNNNMLTSGTDASRYCRMACSGFIKFSQVDLDYFHLQNITFSTQPKALYLVSLLEKLNLPSVIIFYNFDAELAMLKKIGTHLNYTITEINGHSQYTGQINKDAKNMILVHYMSGAMGLNLQHYAHHLVFYSPSCSCENYIQAKGRIDRLGQTEDCFIYNLIIKHSIEEVIYRNLTMHKSFIEKTFSFENTEKALSSVNETK